MSSLTGRLRYRLGWRGKLVLQVEYRARVALLDLGEPLDGRHLGFFWRDARVEDLASLSSQTHGVAS